jgi:TPR repeat protein
MFIVTKYFVLVLIMGFLSFVYAQEPIVNSLSQDDLKEMSSGKIYSEMEKSKKILQMKHSINRDLNTHEDSDYQIGVKCLAILEQRRKEKEPEASYYYGLHKFNLCTGLKKQKELHELYDEITINEYCHDAQSSFIIASDADIPQAMYMLGIINRDGLGVNESKLVAAEWFMKSAARLQKIGNTKGALLALEEVLKIVPDHPHALQLHSELLAITPSK